MGSYTVVLSSHVIFKMGCCVFKRMPQLQQRMNFSISVCFDIRNDLFSCCGPALCKRLFFPHVECLYIMMRGNNLIFTFIYRTDCSNEVITISSALRFFLIPVLLLPLSANFGPIHSLKNACETMQMRTSEQMNVSWKLLWWENANEDEWVNKCFMNACLMKRTY